jgi:hypothetical protein
VAEHLQRITHLSDMHDTCVLVAADSADRTYVPHRNMN